ncbi:hypothetical protein Tdes44962_MAKER00894 [Teratosphaeria destructans]|uniref:Uncharacterized protein n=1 Tax=Teratosphaeria destructans TaxID=418781 RepID=A0A9W7VZ11_9PEZI|nr:hypothetical protein Tdes44962_MAKER00894 [Teratosphaeria destructans]
MTKRVTPAWAVASNALMAPSWSTVLVRSGFPAPAPADQMTAVTWFSRMVWARSSTELDSMDCTMGLPPRPSMAGIWSGLRMTL